MLYLLTHLQQDAKKEEKGKLQKEQGRQLALQAKIRESQLLSSIPGILIFD